jgi:hypothetical protein
MTLSSNPRSSLALGHRIGGGWHWARGVGCRSSLGLFRRGRPRILGHHGQCVRNLWYGETPVAVRHRKRRVEGPAVSSGTKRQIDRGNEGLKLLKRMTEDRDAREE